MRYVALALMFATAGCTDIFTLPIGSGGPPPDASSGATDLATPTDSFDLDVDSSTPTNGDGGDAGTLVLPASCALLNCTPTVNEGSQFLAGGDITGCHAYTTLTIAAIASVKARRDPVTKLGFSACADTISVAGALSADGEGEIASMGTGAGKLCGSGGSHGGSGADPGVCGTGMTYGDPMLPRTAGSGGGGLTATAGGAGGGTIELSANQINVLGFITADGEGGNGTLGGGGAGGSVLLHARDSITGAGQVFARGGLGIGISGGGGGGGRVAIISPTVSAGVKIDVKGGSSMSGGAAGTMGTIYHP